MSAVRAHGLSLVAACAVLLAAAATGCGSEESADGASASAGRATKTVVLGADGQPITGAQAAGKPTGGEGDQPSPEAPADGAVAVPANQATIQQADQLVSCLTRAGRQATYESATAYEMPTTQMTAALRAGDGGTVVEVEPSMDSDGDSGPTVSVFLLGDASRARGFYELLSESANTELFAEETGQKDFETGYRLKTSPDIGRAGDAVVVSSDFLVGDEEQLFAETCGLGPLTDE